MRWMEGTGYGLAAVGLLGWLADILGVASVVREWACDPQQGCPPWLTNLMALPWSAWLTPAIVVLGVGLLWLQRRRDRPQGPVTNLYGSREALQTHAGGLLKELSTADEAWAMWPSGTVIGANEDYVRFRKLRRLILLDVDSPEFPDYCRRINFPPQNVVATIRNATELAQRAGVEVRWHPHSGFSLVILNPNAHGVVRWELLLAHRPAAERPSLIISQHQYIEAFDAIRNMFNRLWDEAKPAPQLSSTASQAE